MLYIVFIVASFAEAWIEIFFAGAPLSLVLSPPSRRRGLKSFTGTLRMIYHVASFAEAWIEILNCRHAATIRLSPPSRRRGLKYLRQYHQENKKRSPPSRRRGLKFLSYSFRSKFQRRLLRGGVD